MAKDKQKRDSKEAALKASRSLNPRPKGVSNKIFCENPFFDSKDLVQVKYEMLRQVDKEGASVSQASREFGMSRPAFYQAKADFEAGGIPALVGQKRGPKKPHKITADILAFIEREIAISGVLDSVSLARSIEKTFKVKAHPRSIERAIERKKKRKQMTGKILP